MSKILMRLQNLFFNPREAWEEIEKETSTASQVFQYYLSILVAVPAGAGFLGWLFTGENFFLSLLWAVLCYGFCLLAVWLAVRFLTFIAPHFETEVSEDLAAILAAYAFTPVFAVSVFLVLPGFSFLLLLGFYGLFVFYLGVEKFVEIPEAKQTPFLLTASLGMLVLFLIALGFAARFTGMLGLLP